MAYNSLTGMTKSLYEDAGVIMSEKYAVALHRHSATSLVYQPTVKLVNLVLP